MKIQIINLKDDSHPLLRERLHSLSPEFPENCLSSYDREEEYHWEDWDPYEGTWGELQKAFSKGKGERYLLELCRELGSPDAILLVRDEDEGDYECHVEAYKLDSPAKRRINKFNGKLMRVLGLAGELEIYNLRWSPQLYCSCPNGQRVTIDYSPIAGGGIKYMFSIVSYEEGGYTCIRQEARGLHDLRKRFSLAVGFHRAMRKVKE